MSHRTFRNERTRSTPLDPKLTFWCVLYYLGAFGTAWLPYETRCKTGRTSAKVRATKSHRTFRNERTRSAPLDPIMTFWCVRTIWVHTGLFGCLTKLGTKRDRTGAKVHAAKSHRNFSQLKHPIRPIGPYNDVLVRSYCLGAFGTVWLRYKTRCKTGSAKVCAKKWRRNFSQRMHPIHPIGP